MPCHILVFGSTSPLGQEFCQAALGASHTLTLYVRNASKLHVEISSNTNIIIGNLFDAEALEAAINCGATTCVSFLGPVLGNCKRGQMPVTNGYELIVPLLRKHNYRRVLITSTASFHVTQDRFSLVYSFMVWSVYLFFRAAYDEINGFTPLITKLPIDNGMKWTVFRVPILGKGKAKGVKAGYVGEVGVKVEREGVAQWVIKEMEEGKWVGKCPCLANA
jgi:hypothetical protein